MKTLLCSLALAAAPALAAPCDPTYVSTRGAVIEVSPTGGEDTVNLQCALDAAAAAGRAVVRLAPGTFRTAQLRATGFVGELRGAGMGVTVISNPARPIDVDPDVFGGTGPGPFLVTFDGGDFGVSDLAIRIEGEAPTTGWYNPGYASSAIACAVQVVGAEVHAAFERVAIEGAPAPSDPLGLNVWNGIFFGAEHTNPVPTSGAFRVERSVFRNVGSPFPAGPARDATIAISSNRFEGALVGGEFMDLVRTTYTFAANEGQAAWAALQAYDLCMEEVCGTSGSRIVVAGNAVSAWDGVELFPTFGDGVTCTIAGNDLAYDGATGGVAVRLGPGTRGCVVSTDGAVADDGQNRIVPGR